MGPEVELLRLEKILSTEAGSSPDLNASKNHLRRPDSRKTNMKYSQACILKKQADVTIERLTLTVVGRGATDAARTRLEVAHVSGVQQWTELVLI